METIVIKFNRPTTIPNVGCYRVGEVAGFSRQLADSIIKRGHGAEYVDPARATRKNKQVSADQKAGYETK